MSSFRLQLVAVVLGLNVLPLSTYAATSSLFHYVKIADTRTQRPGGSGPFTGFGIPSTLGFVGTGDDGAGVYRFDNAFINPAPSIFKLADTNTPIPGGSGTFTGFDAPSFNLYYRATGANGQQGIYQGAATTRYVDTNTPIPGGSGTFTAFGAHAPFGEFYGEGTGGQKGLYTNKAVGVDIHTPIPGQPGKFFNTFKAFSGPIFHAGSDSADVVYSGAYNIEPLADSSFHIDSPYQTAPTLGPVIALGTGFLSRGFSVLADPDRSVYYMDPYQHIALTMAKPTDLRPDGAGPLGEIAYVASGDSTIEGGPVVAFTTVNDDRSDIYFRAVYGSAAYAFPARVVPIIGTGDILDGRQVSAVEMGDDAIDHYSVTFRAEFTDGSSGIYTAFALDPEPSALLPVALFLLAIRRPMRRVGAARAHTPERL
jgi:hypothetical protein